jgi:nucleoside-diphosphate-sugar epimerase
MPTMGRSVLITGASGFLGGSLLKQLAGRADRVVCFGRRRPDSAGVEFRQGDLLQPEDCRRALEGCDEVVHLAAVTGKQKPEEYFRVNTEGTRVLLAAAKEAGAGSFLFVSSIAAGFQTRFPYPYAESKRKAEDLVRAGGVPWTIVRPTMIFGPGSPVQQGLKGLATLPVVPLFGDGRVQVQPVFVEDVAGVIADLRDSGRTVEIGGPDVLSMEELLLRMRQAAGITNRRVLHLPLGPIAACLAAVEPLLRPLMPVTAGQLASFGNPGTAAPDPFVTPRQSSMRGIGAMLR